MEQERKDMLDNLDNFKYFIEVHYKIPQNKSPMNYGQLYCPKCSGIRRMSVRPIIDPINTKFVGGLPDKELAIPSLFIIMCTQCYLEFTALIYKGANGESLAILPTCDGGLSTALQKYTNVFSAIRQSGGKEKRNQSEYGPTKHQGHGG